jgi:hypothetical protein
MLLLSRFPTGTKTAAGNANEDIREAYGWPANSKGSGRSSPPWETSSSGANTIFPDLAGLVRLFFRQSHPVASRAFAVTAGFLMRPLGAFLFGWIDRVGRKTRSS